MGSCVSVHKSSESAMKLGMSVGSKPDKLVSIPPSPVKPATNGDPPINDQWSPPQTNTAFRDYGSKEESFFDTKPWLDSDCEDDFYSVNGEFTPSRGNTPVHHNFRVNKTSVGNKSPVYVPAPAPVIKKKKLCDLFKESFRDVDEGADTTDASDNLPQRSVNGTGTPYVSGSERTANGDVPAEKERPWNSPQCCLPTFVSFRSSSQRRKTRPAIAVSDKA